ncbi:hypothetical protein E2C01_013270 [Portunus trituberculatus]|uniref:Uncharacterized protein n=1 Tax=Portunus trituberculatus TaxID=210409 RepID=A0A5B7DG75_PORTR|nr:hypothetical protein [Portunus trituberculatus]
MNPLWQLSSTEGENDRSRAPSDTVNHFNYFASFNNILVSHAIDNLGRVHVHKIAAGGDSPLLDTSSWTPESKP